VNTPAPPRTSPEKNAGLVIGASLRVRDHESVPESHEPGIGCSLVWCEVRDWKILQDAGGATRDITWHVLLPVWPALGGGYTSLWTHVLRQGSLETQICYQDSDCSVIGECPRRLFESTLNYILFGTLSKGRSSTVALIECMFVYVLYPPASENNGVVETCRNGPNRSKEETRRKGHLQG